MSPGGESRRPKCIEWEETSAHEIAASELDPKWAMEIHRRHGRRIHIDSPTPWNGQRYRLTSRGYVGSLPVGDDLVLRILPKVPVSNVFRMLEYAYDLKSFQTFEGTAPAGSIQELFESLASILSSRVLDRVRKGLYRSYFEEQDALPFVRGRVLVQPSLRAQYRSPPCLECEYEELTENQDDNRILTWTLFQLRRLPIEREDVRERIRKAYRAMASAAAERPMTPRDCIGRFYDRLNQDYRPMHALCRFFLEHCGPTLDAADHELLPFSVHMPTLFEAFVARWLQRHLPEGLNLASQLFAGLEQTGELHFKIDLVLSDQRSGRALAILDTKYKDDAKPQMADIHQVVAYASRMRATTALLVYPSATSRAVRLDSGIQVYTVVFDLSRHPDEAGRAFLDAVLDHLPPH